MLRTRVMPCLLLKGKGLVKTIQFKKEIYIGDPINAVRIFNQKEVDELILIDIDATVKSQPIQFDLIEQVTSECFMPICYGGGVKSLEDFNRLFALGIEKVSVSSALFETPELIAEAAARFGSQSIVVTLDAKRHWLSKKLSIYTHSAKKNTRCSVTDAARQAEELGAGEILIYSVDKDGTWSGFDEELVKQVAEAVSVPVIAMGGAGHLEHIKSVVHRANASAVGLGSMAVLQSKDMGVLIKFPKIPELELLLSE